jgi:hypothetical protein
MRSKLRREFDPLDLEVMEKAFESAWVPVQIRQICRATALAPLLLAMLTGFATPDEKAFKEH